MLLGAYDCPFGMVNYSDVKHGNHFYIPGLSIKDDGDVVIGASGGSHIILGGHASIGFNVTEFFTRLFD